MDFREILNLLLKKKWYTLVIPVFTAMLAFSVRFFLFPRIYASESQISTGLTTGSLYTDEGSRMSPFEVMLNFENLMENMESKMVINRLSYVLLRNDLTSTKPFRVPEKNTDDLDSSMVKEVVHLLDSAVLNFVLINKSSRLGLIVNNLAESYRYTEEDLKERASIKRVGSSDFINIRYETENPPLSAFVVNEWARTFIQYYQYVRGEVLTASLEELNRILTEKKRLLDFNTLQLNKFRGKYSGVLSKDADPIFEFEKLIREKSSEVNGLKIRLENVRDQLVEIENLNSDDAQRKKIIEIRNLIDSFQTEPRPDQVDYVLADSLALLKSQLILEMTRYSTSSSEKQRLNELFQRENDLMVEYEIARTELNNLQEEYENQKGSAANSSFINSKLKNLETLLERSRDEYLLAQDKYNKARSRQIVKDSKLKISYLGDVPELPQSRKTIIFSIMGLIVGGVGTIFMIGLLYFLDQKILNPFKFKRVFGEDPIATIPYFSNAASVWEQSPSRTRNKQEETNKHGFNKLKHSVNTIRHEVQTAGAKVFLFTSLKESSGKSVTLSLVASSLSQLKKKVLIIDTNFRNPAITRMYGNISEGEEKGIQYAIKYKNTENLTSILGSPHFIQKQDGSDVYLMGGQELEKSPEEVFSPLGFRGIMEHLRDQFDYIFLEGASIDSNADSIELMDYSDFVIFVFSLSDEIKSGDMSALKKVKEKAKSYFTVLNSI